MKAIFLNTLSIFNYSKLSISAESQPQDVLPPPPPSLIKEEVRKDTSSKKPIVEPKKNSVKKSATLQQKDATKTDKKENVTTKKTDSVSVKKGNITAKKTDNASVKKESISSNSQKADNQTTSTKKENVVEKKKSDVTKPVSTENTNHVVHKTETKKGDTIVHKHEPIVNKVTVEKPVISSTKDSIVLKPFPVLKKKAVADTLHTPIAKHTEKPKYTQFYSNHLLRATHTNPVQLNNQSYDWIFYVLLFVVSAFTIVKTIHRKSLTQIKEAFLSNTISNQIVRDDNILFQRASVFLTIIFYLTSSLFLYKISNLLEWNNTYLASGFNQFLIFMLLISLTYSLKFIILKFIGFIFQIDKPITIYIFNIFLINNVLGILFIPLLIGACFLPHSYATLTFNIAILALVLAFIYRIIRGVMIGVSYPNFSIYYLFLYICTLEIAPMLLLLKILM
jgi:hypothetical protein